MKTERTDQYVAVILDDNSEFFLHGFKILNKQHDKGLLSCMKVYHNGKIKLIYRIGPYLSLEDWMKKGQKKHVRRIIRRLVDTVLEMKTNGFLQASNLILEPDKIFIDGNSYQTYMMVLPLIKGTDTQKEWKKQFVELLKEICRRMGERIGFLEMEDVSVEFIAKSLEMEHFDHTSSLGEGKEAEKSEPEEPQKKEDASAKGLILEYIEGGLLHRIAVEGPEFILGKSDQFADGVISGVPTISRKHCRIISSETGCQVTDLGSLNGTYVNQIKIREGELAALKPGDVLKLAELEMRVYAGRK